MNETLWETLQELLQAERDLGNLVRNLGAKRFFGGVYATVCLENGWVYLGSAPLFVQRKTYMKCLLDAGRHPCGRLQADWLRYGEDKFYTFELKYLGGESNDALAKEEQRHLDFFQEKGYDIYNLTM